MANENILSLGSKIRFSKNPKLLEPLGKATNIVKINNNHKFAYDLRFSWGGYANENGSRLRDYSYNDFSDEWSGTTRVPGKLVFGNSSDYVRFNRQSRFEPANYITIITRMNVSTTNGDRLFGALIKPNTVFSNYSYYYRFDNRTAENNRRFLFYATINGTRRLATPPNNSFASYFDEDLWFVGQYDGSDVKSYVLSEFGELLITGTFGGGLSGTINYYDTKLEINNMTLADESGMQSDSTISDIHIWGYPLSYAQILEFIKNPYAMYEDA